MLATGYLNITSGAKALCSESGSAMVRRSALPIEELPFTGHFPDSSFELAPAAATPRPHPPTGCR
jgi:hypothetical protein